MPIKNPFGEQQDSPEKVLDNTGSITEENFLLYRLKRLIREGKINEGENLLFMEIEDFPTIGNLKVALSFYDILKKIDDEILEKSNFSRDEIEDGIDQLKSIYKMDNIEDLVKE